MSRRERLRNRHRRAMIVALGVSVAAHAAAFVLFDFDIGDLAADPSSPAPAEAIRLSEERSERSIQVVNVRIEGERSAAEAAAAGSPASPGAQKAASGAELADAVPVRAPRGPTLSGEAVRASGPRVELGTAVPSRFEAASESGETDLSTLTALATRKASGAQGSGAAERSRERPVSFDDVDFKPASRAAKEAEKGRSDGDGNRSGFGVSVSAGAGPGCTWTGGIRDSWVSSRIPFGR